MKIKVKVAQKKEVSKKIDTDFIKILQKQRDNEKITLEEYNHFQKVCSKILNEKASQTAEFEQAVYRDVEEYIEKGLLTKDKVIDYICQKNSH